MTAAKPQKIGDVRYPSCLDNEKRDEYLNNFTKHIDKAHLFIGNYRVGSIGLNLYQICYHSVEFNAVESWLAYPGARANCTRKIQNRLLVLLRSNASLAHY